MTAASADWPESGELVIATVMRIIPHGAYVTLDDYGRREGFLHVSEVSTTWVRNIRDFVREGRKLVLKVLRVDRERGHIDLSLKRVSDQERREELLDWKRRTKGRAMLDLVAQRLNIPVEKARQEVAAVLEKEFGGVYEAFEKARERGMAAFEKTSLNEEVAKAVCSVAMEKVKLPTVTVKADLELTCPRPDGVEVIRKALLSIEELGKKNDAEVMLYVVGAPRYRMEVTAKTYKRAEKVLEQAVESGMDAMKRAGGTFSSTRVG
ncbi:MAG: translation initiation factor IF-2 subunit alpha [Candidatus Bathyarchaeia archaeon]